MGGTENEMHWLRLDHMTLPKVFRRVKGQWHLLQIPQQEMKLCQLPGGSDCPPPSGLSHKNQALRLVPLQVTGVVTQSWER